MDIILFHSIWTVALLVLFIGIWVWAWSGKRRSAFDAAARLPLDDDDMTQSAERGEKNNG